LELREDRADDRVRSRGIILTIGIVDRELPQLARQLRREKCRVIALDERHRAFVVGFDLREPVLP